MKHFVKIFGFALLLSFLVQGCRNSDTSEEKEVLKPVKYEEVESFGGLTKRIFNGTTESSSETNLSFRTGGMVSILKASVGQRITQGQLLAQLDQKDAQLALDQAQIDVNNAKVQLETSNSSFERTKQLYQSNNVSLSDYEKAKSSLSSAQSSYEISLKRYELQKSQLSYTSLFAPMTGIISKVNIQLNEVINAGKTVLIISQEESADIQAKVGLPEKYISQIKQGDKTIINVPSIEAEFEGVITEVGYSSDRGSYPVTVKMISPTDNVRPGMPAEVTFTFGETNERSILIAPLKAVASGVDGNYVFRLFPENDKEYTAQKTLVELGEVTKDGYEIKSGLNQGDLVAVAGLNALYDGKKVKLLTR